MGERLFSLSIFLQHTDNEAIEIERLAEGLIDDWGQEEES